MVRRAARPGRALLHEGAWPEGRGRGEREARREPPDRPQRGWLARLLDVLEGFELGGYALRLIGALLKTLWLAVAALFRFFADR